MGRTMLGVQRGAPDRDAVRQQRGRPSQDGIRIEQEGAGTQLAMPARRGLLDHRLDGVQPTSWMPQHAILDQSHPHRWGQPTSTQLRRGQHPVLAGCRGQQCRVELRDGVRLAGTGRLGGSGQLGSGGCRGEGGCLRQGVGRHDAQDRPWKATQTTRDGRPVDDAARHPSLWTTEAVARPGQLDTGRFSSAPEMKWGEGEPCGIGRESSPGVGLRGVPARWPAGRAA
jgi:hypothetical protein